MFCVSSSPSNFLPGIDQSNQIQKTIPLKNQSNALPNRPHRLLPMAWKFWTKSKPQRPAAAKPPLHTQIKQYYSRLTTSTSNRVPSSTMDHASRDMASKGPPCVVMPLYIYPLPDTDPWKPSTTRTSPHLIHLQSSHN